ncbi:MAG: hypothetical protein FVQ82_17390 [Planctomycetes bacterium]|nr:hypothetical protein [Planctomycetota bacterium]
MSNKKELQFTCQKCGGKELGYQKFVKCLVPVTIKDDNNMEYGLSIIHEDDYLAILNSFACGSCGSIIEHCGIRMETEKQLIDYLTMEPFDRLHQQQDHQELIDAQIDAQEQKEKELANLSVIEESD